jgi:hypothetical protein
MMGRPPRPSRLDARCIFLNVALCCPLVVRAAGQPERGASRAPARTASSWQILETDNFRVMIYGTRAVDAATAQACEELRSKLYVKWTGDESPASWQPKCDVVLHPNDASYLREVGGGAASTLASSLVDQQRGQIRLRRIDVRTANSDWIASALPHELTHVILAQRFAGRTLPRWIDEGVAIQADPAGKRSAHKQDLRGALASRTAFRLVELFTLEQYPAAHRWGTFYGQSASVVEYLVAQKSPAAFVEFVELALENGYDASLRQIYGIAGVAELERNWNSQALRPAPSGAPDRSGAAIGRVAAQ